MSNRKEFSESIVLKENSTLIVSELSNGVVAIQTFKPRGDGGMHGALVISKQGAKALSAMLNRWKKY